MSHKNSGLTLQERIYWRPFEITNSGSGALVEIPSLHRLKISSKILSASLWIIASALVIYLFPLWLFSVVITGLICIALIELFKLARDHKIPIHIWTGMTFGISIPIATYLVGSKIIPLGSLVELDGVLLVTILFSLFVAQSTRRENTRALAIVGVTFIAVFYISWLFSFLIKLRVLPQGCHLVAYLLLVAKGSDVGGYLIGSRFGRHHLIPRISPNKSVEGFWGGLLVSCIAAYFCQLILPMVPLWHLLLTGVVLGGISQFGDLAESIIKRDCQVKDSGSLIPGIGGIMDLIDSLLLSAPLFYYWVIWGWKL